MAGTAGIFILDFRIPVVLVAFYCKSENLTSIMSPDPDPDPEL
jgi:hypothetical protein